MITRKKEQKITTTKKKTRTDTYKYMCNKTNLYVITIIIIIIFKSLLCV